MSFKDDYKNQIDNLRTDNYIREKVLKKIEEKQNEKSFKFPVLKVASAVACLCLAVAISLPFTLNNNKKGIATSGVTSNTVKENTANSYSDIYEKVRTLKKQARFEMFATDDVVLYEIDEDKAATDGAVSSPKPGVGLQENKAESTTDSETKGDDYSETNTQVEGVDEADIIKTDGEYIYSLSAKNEKIRIIKAGKTPKLVASIEIEGDNSYSANMYLSGDRLVVYTSEYNDFWAKSVYGSSPRTVAVIYDISNPEKPTKITECEQDGDCLDSRLIGNKLYLISDYNVDVNRVSSFSPKTYVPVIECKDYSGAVPADSVHINEDCTRLIYTVISAFDITDGTLCSTRSILGGTYTVYCSTGNIITAGYSSGDETKITRYSISDGIIEFKAEGLLKGSLLNQFSIDEHKGYFRFVTTDYGHVEVQDSNDTKSIRSTQVNCVYIFDGDLKQVGAIENLAPDERVYSVRFMGDIAYFVTFRQVDPLFSADLSDPVNPKIIGKLKIPGFSSYMHPYGEGKLLGIGMDADEKTGRTETVKLSMFDISDPKNVTEGAKVSIDFYYSEALDNHKAVLIDVNRNIIGFSGYVNDGMSYCIYAFEKGKFVRKATIGVEDLHAHSVRGLFIGNELYIVEDSSISVYDLKSFELINKTEF